TLATSSDRASSSGAQISEGNLRAADVQPAHDDGSIPARIVTLPDGVRAGFLDLIAQVESLLTQSKDLLGRSIRSATQATAEKPVPGQDDASGGNTAGDENPREHHVARDADI